MNDDDRASKMAELAAELNERDGEVITTQAIVDSAVELLDEADHASLTLKVGRGYETLASTSDKATEADSIQYALREGPCVESAEEGEWYRSGDVGHDPRWPRWGPKAAELGMQSLLAVRLLSNGKPLGALNLYSERSSAFAGRDDVSLALVYAVHATTALVSARLVANLETAMSSRHQIGMAQGILMGRYGLTVDSSFAALRRASQQSNMLLREIAVEVVRTKRLPGATGLEADLDAPLKTVNGSSQAASLNDSSPH